MSLAHAPVARIRRRRPNDQLGRLLVTCLADRGADPEVLQRLVAEADISHLPEAARYHRVVAPVYESLRHVEAIDLDVMSRLRGFYREAVLAEMRALGTIEQVREALDALGAPWLIIKGPVLASVVYTRRKMRLYHDVDVVVPRLAFAGAFKRLEAAGFEPVHRNWPLINEVGVGEISLGRLGSSEVDLHWHLLYGRELRRQFRIPMDDLIRRARRVIVNDNRLLTFDATDTLIHVALHACLEGGDRLLWLKDIEQAAANDRPDWDELVRRATGWGVALPVGTALGRARALLAAPVPDDVMHALVRNPAWRTLLRFSDRLYPAERSTGRGTLATVLARSARQDVASTLSAVLRGSLSIVKAFALTGRWTLGRWERVGIDPTKDPRNPRSFHYAAGDERDRERFLENVLRESGAP